MLDMGFIGDMRELVGQMPKERHTLFFSATLSRDIEKLIGDFLNDPVRISVKTRDTAATVDQDVVYYQSASKFDTLVSLLKDPEMDKVLVFGRTKHGVERLTRDLNHAGIKADSIHGDKTHGRRQKALGLFKHDQVRVLVATDVAARGLDISGVSHVINYDLPSTYEDYTHRIGRTGRAGAEGLALSLVSHDESGLLRDIRKLLDQDIAITEVPGFEPSAPLRLDAGAPRPKQGQRQPRPPRQNGNASGQRPHGHGSSNGNNPHAAGNRKRRRQGRPAAKA